MDILMIGHSGSGKTTYMAALYAEMSTGFSQYRIKMSDVSKRKDLENVKENLYKGHYPIPTDIQQEYDFELYNENSTLSDYTIPFNWFDYRGGVLFEKSKQSQDAALFFSQVRNSNALLIFLDGDILVQSLDNNEKAYKRLIWCIRSALNQSNTQYPISFIITKGDKYKKRELLKSQGFRYFKNVIEEFKQNDNIQMIITITEINYPVMKNVTLPLFFSIYHGLPNVIKEQEEKIDHEQAYLDSLYPNVFNDIKGWINKNFGNGSFITERQKYEWSKERLNSKRKELKALNKNRKYLKKILNRERAFFNKLHYGI